MKLTKISITCGVFALASIGLSVTIADLKSHGDGYTDILTGVTITSIFTDILHIQDNTGAMQVYDPLKTVQLKIGQAFGAVSPIGCNVDLVGSSLTFKGVFELNISQAVALSVGAPPTPLDVMSADFQDGSGTAEGLESKLVKLHNVVFDSSGTFTGGSDNLVTGNGLKTNIRIYNSSVDLVGTSIPSGPVNITGIFHQFSDDPSKGYRLLVRSASDIEPVPEPGTMVALASAVAILSRRRR